jgi:hypothetical protein
MIGSVLTYVRIQAQSVPAARDEVGAGSGIAAGKERHVMALPDQLVRQVSDDAFGASLEPRRHTLNERRDLGNFHGCLLAIIGRSNNGEA